MLSDAPASAIPIALLGADALLAARPATPVQVLHGCMAAGFVAAYPVSWGDELVARECLSRLEQSPRACVLCACPHAAARIARERLPLEPIALASPPVAAAQLVRGAYKGQPIRITYVGACPSGAHPSIDAHITPAAFLGTLRERGIELTEQPKTFEAVLPPDRRRFHSLPGGCPDPERLEALGYRLVEQPDLPEQMPDDTAVLMDIAVRSGCVCSGAPADRTAVAELEPPRAPHAIIDPVVSVDLSPSELIAAIVTRVVTPRPETPSVGEPLGESVEPPAPDPLVVKEDTAPVVEAAAASVASDAPRREGERRETPAGQRGFNANEVPLRGGPVREFMRPVFPRSESVYEDEPRNRRFSGTVVIAALLLGLSLPLAAFGAWVLLGHGPGVVRSTDEGSVPAYDATSPVAGARSNPVDSAAGVAVTDTTGTDTSAVSGSMPPGARGPGAATSDSAHPDSAVARRTAHPEPIPRSSRLAAKRAKPQSARDGGRASAAATSAPPATDSGLRTTDTATHAAPVILPSEIDSLMREIARRRARVDSLSHMVDSLKKPPTRGKPPV
jgi:hypothetical protein